MDDGGHHAVGIGSDVHDLGPEVIDLNEPNGLGIPHPDDCIALHGFLLSF